MFSKRGEVKILQQDTFITKLHKSLQNSTSVRQEPLSAASCGLTVLWQHDGLTDHFPPSCLVRFVYILI